MIGNDIVDLHVAQQESDWKRPRFLEKIFTKKEQFFLESASDKHKAVWLLWSRKESAYKIISRLTNKRFYTPKKFETVSVSQGFKSQGSQLSGLVNFENYSFFTTSTVTEQYIHTVAQCGAQHEPLTSKCFYVEENNYAEQHLATQNYLLESYATLAKVSLKDLSIQKDTNRVPHLFCKNQKQKVSVSTSHHGHYGGFVLESISDK